MVIMHTQHYIRVVAYIYWLTNLLIHRLFSISMLLGGKINEAYFFNDKSLNVTKFAIRDLIHKVSRHTFHRHLIATSMCQQHMCLKLLKVKQFAFTQASFSSLYNVHECSGGLQMVPSFLDKQTIGCYPPRDWLISLAMDLAALCDMQR